MTLEVLKKSIAWMKGHQLTLAIYQVTKTFPSEEKFGLASQMQRAAVSIPSNIAEGRFRNSRKEFARFLSISKGSCAELATQLSLAYHLKYIEEEQLKVLENQIIEIIKILQSSITTLLVPNS